MSISIKGLDKAEVLAALYNGAQAQGLGYIQSTGRDMTKEEAQQVIDRTLYNPYFEYLYFDYLYGRVLKIDLSGDECETHLYNRDNGAQRAEEIISGLRFIKERG